MKTDLYTKRLDKGNYKLYKQIINKYHSINVIKPIYFNLNRKQFIILID